MDNLVGRMIDTGFGMGMVTETYTRGNVLYCVVLEETASGSRTATYRKEQLHFFGN